MMFTCMASFFVSYRLCSTYMINHIKNEYMCMRNNDYLIYNLVMGGFIPEVLIDFAKTGKK